MKKRLSMLAAVAILLNSGYAFASDWNFYGSARVSTFWTDKDLADTTSVEESLHGNARIGAKVNVSDELTGQFEYGAKNGVANVRYLYGEWNFGPGTLLVGKYETPLYMPVSSQVYNEDNGLEGWGEADPGKHAQVRLKFNGFSIAIVEPDDHYFNGTDVVNTSVETQIPRIEASYMTTINNLTLGAGAGYSTFEYNDREDIDSYVGVVSAKLSLGAFLLGAQGFMGQNVGNIITADTTGDDRGKGYAQVSSGKVIDNDATGFEVVAGYTVNDMIGIEAGYGYMQTEYDNAQDDEVTSVYLQVPVTLAPGVSIVPEVGMIDYEEDTQEEITYFGAKWQINF